jgi:hypothetical protein
MKPVVYELKKDCSICGKDEWLRTKWSMRYFLLNNCAGIGTLTTEKGKYVVGFTANEQSVCIKCFELLVGIENYYGRLWNEFVCEPEAKRIVNNILNNKDLFQKCLEYRAKGKFIPNNLIMEAK